MKQSEPLTLLVEGRNDQTLVRWILEAARLPVDRVHVHVAMGKAAIRAWLKDHDDAPPRRTAALIDLDERSVPDANARAREQLGDPAILVFCATPHIEAWLFADDRLAETQCMGDPEALAILRRIPLPEEIPNPKELSRTLFGRPEHCDWIRRMDVQRAAARSPSLRSFLTGMGEALDTPIPMAAESLARSLSRSVLAGLIAEVSPAEAVLWRTTDGEAYTAIDLRRHIEEGDEVGQQYASDLLRVARDLLRRTANRQGAKLP